MASGQLVERRNPFKILFANSIKNPIEFRVNFEKRLLRIGEKIIEVGLRRGVRVDGVVPFVMITPTSA